MKTKKIIFAAMKKLLLTTMLIAGCASAAFAQVKPWYLHKDSVSRGAFGADTRAEATAKWGYKDYMRATATAVQTKYIAGDKVYTGTLADYIHGAFGDYDIDESVNFLDQPTAGFCTGFLIAPDILVTAGHCIKTQKDLESTVWIFDYTADVYYNGSYVTIPQSNQVRGVEILETKLTNDAKYDYCVIRLERTVTGRKPYKFRTSGNPAFNQYVAMIGSPSGLPLKVADSAQVTNTESYTSFLTDLDAFHGNSGGPVFNFNGFIEGILVRGPGWDFHYDEDCDCIVQDAHWDFNNIFGLQADKGNAVHKITHVPWDLLKLSVYRNLEVAMNENNFNDFAEWTIYRWVLKEDISGKENILVKAAMDNKPRFFDTLASMTNADITKKDLAGNSVLHLLARNNMAAQITSISKKEGFDVNQRNTAGYTALMLASMYNNLAAVQALLKAGADAKIKDYSGSTARTLAKKAKAKAIVKLLKKAEKGKNK